MTGHRDSPTYRWIWFTATTSRDYRKARAQSACGCTCRIRSPQARAQQVGRAAEVSAVGDVQRVTADRDRCRVGQTIRSGQYGAGAVAADGDDPVLLVDGRHHGAAVEGEVVDRAEPGDDDPARFSGEREPDQRAAVQVGHPHRAVVD